VSQAKKRSEALSMENTVKDSIKSRVIAFLLADGCNTNAVKQIQDKLESEGAVVQVVAPEMAPVKSEDGTLFTPKHSISSTSSVCFDAVYVASGEKSSHNWMDPDYKNGIVDFLNEAYRHCKAIYFGKNTEIIYDRTDMYQKKHKDPAVILAENEKGDDNFVKAIASHRVWHLELERNGITNKEHQS